MEVLNLTTAWIAEDIDISALRHCVHRITVTYPPPKLRGRKHPGGRLLRKSRLRKKRDKYLLNFGHSYCYNGYVSKVDFSEDKQCAAMQFTLLPYCP